MDAPCKECENKGCGAYHDICQKYIDFRKERKRIIDRDYIDTIGDRTAVKNHSNGKLTSWKTHRWKY